jgi:dipeptidyl aminopeptidase/acylaminoacyl peptidase
MKPHSHLTVLRHAVLMLLVSASTLTAQQKRPMTIVDLINVPSLGDPQISPDGSLILYTRTDPHWDKNRTISHIWRVGTDGSEPMQLTNGVEGESSPRWAPDGSKVAFLTDRGEPEGHQIFLLDRRGGEAVALTEHPTSPGSITWSPDSRWIFFTASDDKTPEEKEREEVLDDVFAYDENYRQTHLWRVEVATGESQRITEGDFSVVGFSLSRDGSMISFGRGPTPLMDNLRQREVWVMSASGGDARQMTHNTVPEGSPQLSPDNSQLFFLADSNEEYVSYYNDNIFLMSASGGEARVLLEDMPYEVNGATWSGDGRYIFFGANTGVRAELFRVDVATEELTQLTRGDHNSRGWAYSPQTGLHVISIQHRTNAGDLFVLEPGSSELRQVTHVFDYLDRDFLLPRQEALQWEGEDGERVEGLLFYPLDYREGSRYPLIVQTHGGPASSDRFQFGSSSDYIQVLAARGYFVFTPNYRGSTGYGDDFLRDMVGSYFNQAHKDVMTGVDHLIDRGLVDGDRMGKMGWSGGGHMTNKIITYTDRFKAASSGAGAVNWISMYGQSDVRFYRTPWFGGTPWQENAPIDVYWEHSPLKDIHKAVTPTLVLVGQNDVRVPMPQSVELYRALKSNGVETHLYVAPREPHGWRELRHRLFKANVELDWWERWVMDREYEWESAPGDEKERG